MKMPLDIISEILHKEITEMAKKHLLTPNKIGPRFFLKKKKEDFKTAIHSMKNFTGVDSVKRTKLPRKLKKKNKKEGVLNIDVTYMRTTALPYIEFKGVLTI